MWATFKVGGIISSANPSYTASELTFQLKLGAFGSGFLEEGGVDSSKDPTDHPALILCMFPQ